MDKVPYKSVLGDYVFTKGVMTISEFKLDADLFDAGMTGTVGLAGEQPINAKGTMVLPKSVVGSVGELLGDAQGKVTVAFSIVGPAASPNVGLDYKELGKSAINAVKNGAFDGTLKKLGLPTFGKP